MVTQVQIRGAATATQEIRTLAARELDVDTTESRLNVHDGSTVGGTPQVNYKDQQNNEFNYAAATGTDALVITLPRAPLAYQTGQSFSFKAAATNTASATLNVNSLGAKTIKKIGSAGAEALSAGDIISGVIYTVFYDGTDLVILSGGGGGGTTLLTAVATTSGTSKDFTLPSGVVEFIAIWGDVEYSATATPMNRLGDSGGVETTGYVSTATQQDATANTRVTSTTGFRMNNSTGNNTKIPSLAHFVLVDSSTNTWICSGNLDITNSRGSQYSGSKSLTSELTTVRFTSSGGHTFAGGKCNVIYRLGA